MREGRTRRAFPKIKRSSRLERSVRVYKCESYYNIHSSPIISATNTMSMYSPKKLGPEAQERRKNTADKSWLRAHTPKNVHVDMSWSLKASFQVLYLFKNQQLSPFQC